MFKAFQKVIAVFVLFTFFFTSVNIQVFAQVMPQGQEPWMPTPGTMVSVSPSFEPALIKGLTVHQDNPFLFDFIVDPGQARMSQETLKEESDRMIKYFFASLTLPDRDIWVNLSPYEKDRMIPASLGVTTMGRDLLAQDYMLKQLTASLIYPQHELGKQFWAKVYSKAQAMYGTTQIPVNTFNKVWIVPQKAGIYEHGQTAFIVSGHLKVMLEEDYLSLKKHNAINSSVIARSPQGDVAILNRTSNDTHSISSQLIRTIILPEIEKEVNEGKNFATLRQIFYAQVLAVWFKRNLKQALLNQVYANKSTVKGIDQNNAATNEAIFRQYLKAYKKGVFNYIQNDVDPLTQESLPRKYFSGGYGQVANMAMSSVALTPKALGEAARSFIISVFAANKVLAASRVLRNAAFGLGLLAASAAPAWAQKPVLLDGKYQQPWSSPSGAYAEAMHSPASLPHGYVFNEGDSIKLTFKPSTAVGTHYEVRLLPEPTEAQRKKGEYGSTEIGLAQHFDADSNKDMTTIFTVRQDRTETIPVSVFKYKTHIIVISVHSGNDAWGNKTLNPDGKTATILKIEKIPDPSLHHDHILNLLRNELKIQDPNVAIYTEAFRNISDMKADAYDDLKQIVLNKEVEGDSLKWAAYLAALTAPTVEEAQSFVDQVNSGSFEWYVKEEAKNGFNKREDHAMAGDKAMKGLKAGELFKAALSGLKNLGGKKEVSASSGSNIFGNRKVYTGSDAKDGSYFFEIKSGILNIQPSLGYTTYSFNWGTNEIREFNDKKLHQVIQHSDQSRPEEQKWIDAMELLKSILKKAIALSRSLEDERLLNYYYQEISARLGAIYATLRSEDMLDRVAEVYATINNINDDNNFATVKAKMEQNVIYIPADSDQKGYRIYEIGQEGAVILTESLPADQPEPKESAEKIFPTGTLSAHLVFWDTNFVSSYNENANAMELPSDKGPVLQEILTALSEAKARVGDDEGHLNTLDEYIARISQMQDQAMRSKLKVTTEQQGTTDLNELSNELMERLRGIEGPSVVIPNEDKPIIFEMLGSMRGLADKVQQTLLNRIVALYGSEDLQIIKQTIDMQIKEIKANQRKNKRRLIIGGGLVTGAIAVGLIGVALHNRSANHTSTTTQTGPALTYVVPQDFDVVVPHKGDQNGYEIKAVNGDIYVDTYYTYPATEPSYMFHKDGEISTTNLIPNQTYMPGTKEGYDSLLDIRKNLLDAKKAGMSGKDFDIVFNDVEFLLQNNKPGNKDNVNQAMAMTSNQERLTLSSDLDEPSIEQINRELERLRNSSSVSQGTQKEAVQPILQIRDIIEKLTPDHIASINQARAASKNQRITIVVVHNGLDIYDTAMTVDYIKSALETITIESGLVLLKDRGEIIARGSKNGILNAISELEAKIKPHGKFYYPPSNSLSGKIMYYLKVKQIFTYEEIAGRAGGRYGTSEQLADLYSGLNVLRALVNATDLKVVEPSVQFRSAAYWVLGTILGLAFLGALRTIIVKGNEELVAVDWRKQADEDKVDGVHQPDVKWYKDGNRNISIAPLKGNNSGKSLRFNFLEQHSQYVQVTPVLEGGWVKGSSSVKVGPNGITHLNVPLNENWEAVIIENKADNGLTFNDHINPVYAVTSEGEVRSFLPYIAVTVESKEAAKAEGGDKAMNNQLGGIDLSQEESALHIEKDANGGVRVDVDPSLIARIEREGLHEVVPLIINMRPVDVKALFGVSVV